MARAVDTLILHGHVLTLDASRPEFPDGGVAVAGGRIVAVGTAEEIKTAHDARAVIDARGTAVLPGLVDAYAHCGHGMIRALFHPDAGWPTYPLYWHATTPEWWAAEARLAALERLHAGVTTGMSVLGASPSRTDSPEYADAVCAAYFESGLGLVLGVGPPDPICTHLPEPFESTHWDGARWQRRRFTYDDCVGVTSDAIQKWHGAGDGRLRMALAVPYLFGRHVPHRRMPHRLPSAGDAPIVLAHALHMRALASEFGVPIHTHMFAGSVAYALRHFPEEIPQLLGSDVTIAHANGLADAEVAVLGAHGCGIATVAYTHENIWYGVAPIPALIAAGCAVAIASDGAAPYTSLDLWREMNRALWNQWVARGDQAVLPPETLLRMVTLDAARALDIADRVGSLEAGKDADVILVDLSRPHLNPTADLAAALVLYGTAADIRTVIAKGEVLLRDGKPTRVDGGAIVAAARDEAAKALARIDLAPFGRDERQRWDGRAMWGGRR